MEISKESWESMVNSQKRIETALLGDEKMGLKGLVHKVGEHDEKFVELEAMKNKGKGMVFSAGIFMGLVGAGIAEAIRYILGLNH